MPLERLHKAMASCGIASRRKCEEIIQAGRVKVNGVIVREMGVKVDLSKDKVSVDGRILHPQRIVLIAMNKPAGIVTTMSDELGRRSVASLLPDIDVSVKPVGRLDKDTEGLLLFTNDGDLASRLTHPSQGVWKTYRAIVSGLLSQKDVAKLEKGVWIAPEDKRGRKTAPAKATLLYADEKRSRSGIELSIHEGAKRQVRLMLDALRVDILELRRTKFGPISLGRLAPGACRMLSKAEEKKLRDATSADAATAGRARPPAQRGKPRARSRGSRSSAR